MQMWLSYMVLKQTLRCLENNDKLKFVQHYSAIDSLSAINSFPPFCVAPLWIAVAIAWHHVGLQVVVDIYYQEKDKN